MYETISAKIIHLLLLHASVVKSRQHSSRDVKGNQNRGSLEEEHLGKEGSKEDTRFFMYVSNDVKVDRCVC